MTFDNPSSQPGDCGRYPAERTILKMLGWLQGKPKCPVAPDTKLWIEQRFARFANELGIGLLQDAKTITPTVEYLPSHYEPTESVIDDLMWRVAQFMGVNPDRLLLSFYEDDKPVICDAEPSSRSNDKCEIWLEVNSVRNLAVVVAALSREIAHANLVFRNIDTADDDTHEQTAELLAVYSGMGIFLANTAIFDSNWTSEGWTGWSVGKLSYLSMDMFGYALSLYSLARSEQSPAWSRHLRPDVRAPFNRGIRYIVTTNDCSFIHANNNAA